MAVRTLVAWCPDWPLAAVGASLHEPSAVVHADRVVAASAAARELGVSRGMRMRAAQGRCPDLGVYARDDSREVREFEPALCALGGIAARIEVLRPGLCAIAVRGPLSCFGSDSGAGRSNADDGAGSRSELGAPHSADERPAHRAARRDEPSPGHSDRVGADDSAGNRPEYRVAELVRRAASEALEGRVDVRIGVADGSFAAELAARAAAPIRLVPPSETVSFLAPLRIGLLGRHGLADVLIRLGIGTIGEFAALPAADVLARFGGDGLAAHRLASGLDERPLEARSPPPDWSASAEIDPPADRVDRVAFVSRSLAEELHRRLDSEGVTCARVAIAAETEHGESSLRVWRHGGELSDAALADRLRWQIDGWVNGSAALRPSGGISRVALMPEELIAARGRQLGFWGGETEADERAARVAARLQGRLGPEAVKVVERRGGRHPHSQIALVPAATAETSGRSLSVSAAEPPWPGALPAPSPTRLLDPAEPAEVLDEHGRRVRVSGSGLLSEPPRWFVPGHARRREIVRWSEPWPVDERWWVASERRRLARMQVTTDDGVARLLALESGRWWETAVWD